MDRTHPSADGDARPREPLGSWSTLFQQSADPIFLLSRRRQIRYVNRAWETLTGKSAESMRGMFCLPQKKKGTQPLRTLLQTLAPTPEVMAGRTATLRRPAPPARLGPPWWDVTFLPLRDESGLTAIFGFIRALDHDTAAMAAPSLPEALIAIRQQAAGRFSFALLHSETAAMQRIEAQARLAASVKTPVWLVGEPGTGKETLARIIHFEGSTREQTFLHLDCGGLQPYLIRAMLFGHAGQAGPRLGTLFLKAPDRLTRELQTELVDWFEEQDEPPRIIVASRDLMGDDRRAGRLLDEFYCAFNVLEIRLPALRDRLEDLPRLANALMRREVAAGATFPELTPEVMALLRQHAWTGNVRELSQLLHEAAAPTNGQRIEPAHLPLELRTSGAQPHRRPVPPLDTVLEQVEARLIRLTLRQAKGNRSEAADKLGIPRARLVRRIEALKIEEA